MTTNHRPDPQDSLISALEQTDFSDESRIRASLRARLIAQLGSSGDTSREKRFMKGSTLLIRIVLIPAGVLLAALIVVLAVPSARAAAEEIIARFGSLLISAAPTGAEQIVASPQAEATLGGVSAPTPNYTGWTYIMPLDEASAALGAPLLAPAFVPDGYALTLRYPIFTSGVSKGIGATYNTSGSTHALIVEQYRFAGDTPQEMGLGSAPVTHVTVRGHDGLWAEQVTLGWVNNALHYNPATGQVDSAPGVSGPQAAAWKLNLLMWEEDGSVFRVMSDTLPQDVLAQVAGSLGQPGASPAEPTAAPSPAAAAGFEVGQTQTAAGIAMTLRRVTLTPGTAQLELCYDLPTGAGDWQPDTQIALDGQPGLAGGWSVMGPLADIAASPRCLCMDFSTPGAANPQHLTVAVSRLHNSPPEAPSQAEQDRALQRLAAQGIEIVFHINDHGYSWDVVHAPDGMDQPAIARAVIDALTEQVDGPWVFEVDIPAGQ